MHEFKCIVWTIGSLGVTKNLNTLQLIFTTNLRRRKKKTRWEGESRFIHIEGSK